MQISNRQSLSLGLACGIILTSIAAVLMGQGPASGNQPVKASTTEYFVTGEGDAAHLWVREGVTLRCVGHGACAAAHKGHDHHDGDGHDHGPSTPKK